MGDIINILIKKNLKKISKIIYKIIQLKQHFNINLLFFCDFL